SRRGRVRQRRGRVDLREQDPGRPGRAHPRPLLCATGRRGRSHEHPLCGRPHGGRERRLGPDRCLPGRQVQSEPETSAPPCEGGVPGARTDEDELMSTTIATETPTTNPTPADLDQLAVNTIRTLSLDAVESAQSGDR